MPKTPEELQASKNSILKCLKSYKPFLHSKLNLSYPNSVRNSVRSENEKQLEKQKAYEELLRLHPDFDDIKGDEKFLEWLQEQPESISDGIYKNNTDARWAARVLDLYKADTGTTKRKRTKSDSSAADAVTRTVARDVKTTSGNDRIWKASEIGRMNRGSSRSTNKNSTPHGLKAG